MHYNTVVCDDLVSATGQVHELNRGIALCLDTNVSSHINRTTTQITAIRHDRNCGQMLHVLVYAIDHRVPQEV